MYLLDTVWSWNLFLLYVKVRIVLETFARAVALYRKDKNFYRHPPVYFLIKRSALKYAKHFAYCPFLGIIFETEYIFYFSFLFDVSTFIIHT